MAGWAAAGQAASSLIGDWISADSQRGTNAMNLQIMRENNAWQEKMSDTAVQRRVSDLRAAGINPMLAAGQSASQPAVSTATMQNPGASFANLGNQIGSALQLKAQIDNLNADTKQKEWNTGSKTGVQYGPDGQPVRDASGNVVVGPKAGIADTQQDLLRRQMSNLAVQSNQGEALIELLKQQKTGQEIENKASQLDYETAQKLQPILIKIQNLTEQQLQQALDISAPQAAAMKTSAAFALAKVNMVVATAAPIVNTAMDLLPQKKIIQGIGGFRNRTIHSSAPTAPSP